MTSIKGFLKSMTLIAGACIVGNAEAQSQYGVTIGALGIQQMNAYFAITPALTLGCNYNNIYIDVGGDANGYWGRTQFSELLAAKVSGKQLSRIDYHQDSSGMCWLDLVEINN